MKRRRFPFWSGLFILLLVGTASFALYSVINQFIADALTGLGITNFYIQNLMAIILIILVLMILGYRIKKSVERVIRG